MRPLEAAGHALLAFSALWLLIVFPFSFSHLPDMLPTEVRFLFFWVTDQVGALVLLISVIAAALSAVYTLILYSAIRNWQLKNGVAEAGRLRGMGQ